MDNKQNDAPPEEGIASQQPQGIADSQSMVADELGLDPTDGSGDRGPLMGSGDR
jgi:hypothetical protein